MVRTSFVAACIVVLLAGVCAAEPGGVTWTALYMKDSPGLAEALSCQGNKIYAAGQTRKGGEGAAGDFALVVYDARTGKPVWSEGGDGGGMATTVKVASGRVYTAGTRTTGADRSPMFVKAYGILNGKPLWERLWPDDLSAIAKGMTIDASTSRVFVAGSTIEPGQSRGFFSVLAFNGLNGDLLWKKGPGDGEARRGEASAIAVAFGRVFAVGSFRDDTNYRDGFAIRAYNTSTGKLLWEDVQWSESKGAPGAYTHSYATAVTATFNRVYVAGSIYTQNGGGTFAVRVYDAPTGRLIWEDRYNRYDYFHDAAHSIALQGARVFVGGYITQASAGRSFTVRAYDAAKGKLLWSSMNGGHNIEASGVSSLVAAGDRVYAAGTTRDRTAFTVRAYDQETGTVAWENLLPQTGGFGGLGDASSICLAGGGVFAGGASTVDTAGGYAFTVRAFTVR